MASKDVAPVLAKDFVDLKLDQDRMIGAKDLFKKYAGEKSQGIPWFVFLDPAGSALVDSIGPKGNVGFPWEDFEIAHFVTMLEKVHKRITPTDIEFLKQSLTENRKKGTQ
jgi:hypothetical protein